MDTEKITIEDVLWSITDRCNLNCIYCSVAAKDSSKSSKEITPEESEIIISKLSSLPKLNSLIISGGEVTLVRNIGHLLEQASHLARSIYIISNGYQMPAPFLDAVKFHRPTVMITIDALDEEISRITRGPRVLENALQTIEVLKLHEIEIVVISVVTKLNIETLSESMIHLYSRGIRNFLLQQLHCEGRTSRELFNSLSPTHDMIAKLYSELTRIEDLYPDIYIDYNEICFFNRREKVYNEKCVKGINYKPYRLFMCGAGTKFIAIKTNGDVIPCNALQECILGNLYKDEVNAIFNSIESHNLKNLTDYRVNSISGCRGCTYEPVCDGGCRADVIHAFGDPFQKHPYCPNN